MTRKKFLEDIALFSLMHITSSYSPFQTRKDIPKKNSVKIVHLHLLSNHIDKQKEFYHTHGFNVIKENKKYFTIRAGESEITFTQDNSVKNPFYHFAFNIAQNKIQEAYELMRPKISLLKRQTGEEIIHFPNFNSHSIFFEDPCNNILEFIARHDLKNDQATPFTINDLLNVSEIGLVTTDVLGASEKLNNVLDVTNYNPPNDNFTPIGAEDGLIIIVKKDRPWILTDLPADIFPVKLQVHHTGTIDYALTDNLFYVNG